MPRMAPKEQRTFVQRWAALSGWTGMAVVMATLLYWLYLTGIGRSRNWIITAGISVSAALLLFFVYGMGAVILRNLRSPEGRRTIRNGVLVVAILAILSVANVLAYRRHSQWDLTGNRRLTLSPMTVRILKGLKQKITATAFYSQSPQRRGEAMQYRQVQDLLEQYADRSANFKYDMVDYLREPAKAISMQVSSSLPLVLFTSESGGREEVRGTTEKDFTAALLKLTRTQKRKICFTEGHGELNPESFDQGNGATVVKQVLTEQQHEVKTINLRGRQRSVPKDCSVLVIAGPMVSFRPEETKAVKEYLDGGGDALILLRAGGPAMADLLKDWGIKPGDNLVTQLVDMGGLTAISREVQIASFERHDINRNMAAVLFPLVRTVETITPSPTGVTVTPLLRTGPDTTSKPLQPGQQRIDLRPTPKDPKGPFTIAAVAEKSGEKKGRVVVIGAAEWASDMLAQNPSTSNRFLFTNAVNWLADEDALVDIPPKDDPPDQVFLTDEQKVRTFYINLLLFPVACLFMATFVWWKRR